MSTPTSQLEPTHWRVHIPEGAGLHLGRRLLGLTFLERRLREARKSGVDHVWVVVSSDRDRNAIPRLRDERHCASWSLVTEGEAPGAIPAEARVYDVALFAIISNRPPHDAVMSLDPDGDWRPAIRWYKERIVAQSGAGWVAKRLNKPLSLFVSTRLAGTPITPNQWSWLNVALGLTCGAFVAQEPWWSVVLGAFLFQLQSVSDGIDGELAQFRLEYSSFGAWLDTFADNLTLLAFLTGCSWHIFFYAGMEPPAALTLLATGLGAVGFYLAMQVRFCHKYLGKGSLVAWDREFLQHLPLADPLVRFARNARFALKKDFFSLLFFGVCALGLIDYLLHLVVVATLVGTGVVLYLNTRYADFVPQQHA